VAERQEPQLCGRRFARVLREWPGIMQSAFGASLLRLQEGTSSLGDPPMKSIGRGVFELKAATERHGIGSFTLRALKTRSMFWTRSPRRQED